MNYRIFLAVTVLALSACSHAGAQSPTSISQEQMTPTKQMFTALVAQEYITPFAAGDIDRWLEIFDDDIVALHNTMPAMTGKDQVRQFGFFVRDNLIVKDMKVVIEDVRSEGSLAYTWGTFHSRLLMKESGEPMAGHSENGKIFFLWKKQSNGRWKMAVDMGNTLRQPPPSTD